MPSIYKKLKGSDRKFIRKEKSRIRREFLGFNKQEEMISELYKKMLGQSEIKVVKKPARNASSIAGAGGDKPEPKISKKEDHKEPKAKTKKVKATKKQDKK